MPAGIMIPSRNSTPMFGSSLGYGLGFTQQNLMDGGDYGGGPLHSLDQVTQNNSDSDLVRNIRDEDFDSIRSGSENPDGGSCDDQLLEKGPPNKKKKRYHRHTQHQIQELEGFFKECQHPDDKQRKELGRQLGLEPLQVKFWFQNKRTQMKTHNDRHENTHLRTENERLKADNMRFREALNNASCPNCGGLTTIGEMSFDEHNLRLENARLRDEIDRISGIAAKYVGKPAANIPIGAPSATLPPNFPVTLGAAGGDHMYGGAGDFFRSISAPTETDKPVIIELAVAAMEEMIRMLQVGEPLWTTGNNGNMSVLNEDEYIRAFPSGMMANINGFKREASRETAVVIMNHMSLVEILMDVLQWANVFSGIVSRAMTLEVLSTGVAGNYNGSLQVMMAEYQLPTPLVPTREAYFVRYCKQHVEGTWAVVDVSLDSLQQNPAIKCKRKPSGCLIQEMPNGYSKVMWLEHVEADERGVHNLYKQLVASGQAFGAKRWVATLDRQCERLASLMATHIPSADVGVITSAEGRKSMLKLAERMVISFCSGVSASTVHTWTTLSGTGADDVRVMTRKSVDDPGRPPGIILCAATTFWLPVPPKRVFDFLRDENSRSEWDILSNGGIVQEMAHIANGHDTGNCVSLLRVNSTNSSQSNMLILQESCTDASGSFVVYAPVDLVAMNVVLNGGDPDYVALLPSGFSILHDGSSVDTQVGTNEVGDISSAGGSLLTVAFQILPPTTIRSPFQCSSDEDAEEDESNLKVDLIRISLL
ncbi:hypothetical protein MLD38_033403 [Melastoma candidum]|uniref:Uncharacterized protein n=1 Tax=Melastoma candidum TaxID=119954 RepID=A0ACB9M738_9MYRT|nr:hypothetical protein MLD38_033403 [Melastoma candidum]